MCATMGVPTRVVWRTDAGVVVDPINAGGIVLAVIVFTVIWVYLTTLALKTRRTHTAVHRDTRRHMLCIITP